MVSAPFSYIGLGIALVLIVTIIGSVWVLVNKLVYLPVKQAKEVEQRIEQHRALLAQADNLDDEQLEK